MTSENTVTMMAIKSRVGKSHTVSKKIERTEKQLTTAEVAVDVDMKMELIIPIMFIFVFNFTDSLKHTSFKISC